jgi:ribosome biogenesis protein SSF1/2
VLRQVLHAAPRKKKFRLENFLVLQNNLFCEQKYLHTCPPTTRHSLSHLSTMAKPRKKKRTHVQLNHSGVRPGKAGTINRPPKSMVVRMGAGDVGASVSQLTKDFRAMMEPDTASRLKERKSNKLKDYTTMAGPLGITHVFLFSRSKSGNTNLRIAPTPRGPTLHFKVEKYSLCKDVTKSQKHPRGGGKEYLTPPLLVMNNMVSAEGNPSSSDPRRKDLENLTRGVLQNIFPPISAQATPLATIKRIMLWNKEADPAGGFILSLRHYAITTKRTGISKRLRRFDPKEQRAREKKGHALPNLGQLDDVADYLLDPAAGGYTSASETEVDTDAEVEVLETDARRVLSKKEVERMKSGEKKPAMERRNHVEKRAVKLVELGPRMRLRLVKVEEGLCEGRVMWNEFVTKSQVEERDLEAKWDGKRKEKEERRKVQKENVERKRQLQANTKANAGNDNEANGDDEGGEMGDDDAWDSEDYAEEIEAEADAEDEDEDMEE